MIPHGVEVFVGLVCIAQLWRRTCGDTRFFLIDGIEIVATATCS